jgi:hypothetical protein
VHAKPDSEGDAEHEEGGKTDEAIQAKGGHPSGYVKRSV